MHPFFEGFSWKLQFYSFHYILFFLAPLRFWYIDDATGDTNCNAMTFNSGIISTEIAQNCETELFYMCQEIVKVKTGKFVTWVIHF
jgi:hypothetical protein